MENLTLLKQAVMPIVYVAGGLVAGLIIERVLIARLAVKASRTKWKADGLVIDALKGVVAFFFFIAGIYFAMLSVKLDADVLQFLQKLLLCAVILAGTILCSRIAAGLIGLYGVNAEGLLPSTSIFINLTKLGIFLLGALIALQSVGVSITPVLTALGVGGLAVALALQTTLSNLFAGLQILASNQVRPGDYIKLNSGEEGYVVDITWRNTAIKALQNNMIIIPNGKLAEAIITNYSLTDKELAVLVQVGVSYSSDLNRVEAVTIETAREVMKEVAGGIPEFEPFIRFDSFADSSINFTIILRGKEFADQYLIKHELIKQLQHRYREEDIEIPFPIRTVHFKDIQSFKPV